MADGLDLVVVRAVERAVADAKLRPDQHPIEMGTEHPRESFLNGASRL
jgi:hypothetical protein